jgi:hypothetical protein
MPHSLLDSRPSSPHAPSQVPKSTGGGGTGGGVDEGNCDFVVDYAEQARRLAEEAGSSARGEATLQPSTVVQLQSSVLPGSEEGQQSSQAVPVTTLAGDRALPVFD